MGLPEHDKGRPGEERPHNVTTGDIHSVPRCTLCGHHIYARESVVVGIGRDCRRRLKDSLSTADVDVRIAYAAALLRVTRGAA